MATAIAEELTKLGMDHVATAGRAFPLLRETRMAAVVCEPVERGNSIAMRELVQRSAEVGRAIVHGIRHAVEEPPPAG